MGGLWHKNTLRIAFHKINSFPWRSSNSLIVNGGNFAGLEPSKR